MADEQSAIERLKDAPRKLVIVAAGLVAVALFVLSPAGRGARSYVRRGYSRARAWRPRSGFRRAYSGARSSARWGAYKFRSRARYGFNRARSWGGSRFTRGRWGR